MPFPQEHAAQQLEPSGFTRFKRETDAFADGIDVIFGIKTDGTAMIQSIRFNSEIFTLDQARTWLEENDFETDHLEEAESIETREVLKVGRVVKGHDGTYRARCGVSTLKVIEHPSLEEVQEQAELYKKQAFLDEVRNLKDVVNSSMSPVRMLPSYDNDRVAAWSGMLTDSAPYASREALQVLAGYYDTQGHTSLALALRAQEDHSEAEIEIARDKVIDRLTDPSKKNG